MRLKNWVIGGVVALLALPVVVKANADRLQAATDVLNEMAGAGDQGIPRDLIAEARCVVIVPGVKKAALGIGGQYGRGYIVCRKDGHWSAPGGVRIEGGSVGFQIGGSATDVIMVVKNQKGADRLLSNKFTVGADASVAAGPVGRTAAAETDATMRAEMLAWSRTRGVFAGIALKGATLRDDRDENEELYGKRLTNKQIINGNTPVPAAAKDLIAALDKWS